MVIAAAIVAAGFVMCPVQAGASGSTVPPPAATQAAAGDPDRSVLDNPLLLAGRAAEAELGHELHQEIVAGEEYGPPVEEGRAAAVFDRLVPVALALRDNLTYTLTVLDDDEPAAFALPGGYVYATTGLVAALDDDQLAGVLAHELVHTVYSHSLEQMSLMASLEQIAGTLIGGDGARGLLADIGRYLLSLGYSRSQEAEADRIGQRWAAAAGFDPLGLPQALRILDGSPPSRGAAAYLSSHPATHERVAALETSAAGLAPGDPAPPGAAASSPNRLIALVALLVAALAQVLA